MAVIGINKVKVPIGLKRDVRSISFRYPDVGKLDGFRNKTC